jgi:hypothetical protein
MALARNYNEKCQPERWGHSVYEFIWAINRLTMNINGAVNSVFFCVHSQSVCHTPVGATEAQWFWLQPELEAWDRGDSPTLTVVGCHWGPVILTSARIRSQGLGRFPFSKVPKGSLKCMNHRQSTHHSAINNENWAANPLWEVGLFTSSAPQYYVKVLLTSKQANNCLE